MVPSVAILGLIIVLSIETIIGILANIFILVVNFLDWLKNQRLTAADFILVSIGICNILLQCNLTVESSLNLVWRTVTFSTKVPPIILTLDISTFCCSFWLTCWLCVFYCVKITNFNPVFFTWLQLRLSSMVPWLILGSAVGSVILSAPIFWYLHEVGRNNSISNEISNGTADAETSLFLLDVKIATNILGCGMPMLLIVFSIMLMLFSLGKHMWSMRQNRSDSSRPRLETYVRAAGTMIGLLVSYIFIYVALIANLFIKDVSFLGDMSCIIITAAPPVQSAFLIIGNSKLRKVFRRFLHQPEAENA